jgi:outer membrane protein assembly factor BamD (BamD/ComL family)
MNARHRSPRPLLVRFVIALSLLLLSAGTARVQAQPWSVSYFRGLQSLKNKEWDQAIRQITNAINAHPSSQAEVHLLGSRYADYFPYLYRGIAYYQSGDIPSARADLQREETLGEVPKGTRDTRAAELLKQFLPLVRDQKRQGPFVEGMRLFSEKDFHGAVDKFSQVPATSPRYDEAKNFIALAQDEQRKLDDAAAAESRARKARRSAPAKPALPAADTSSRAIYREAVALYDAGKLKAAKRDFQELRIREFASPDVETHLRDIEALEERTLMGVTAYLEGDYPLAVSQLDACARTQSDNPHLLAFLAYACTADYLLTGHRDTTLSRQARDAFGRLQRLAPSYVPDRRFVSPGIISFLKGE